MRIVNLQPHPQFFSYGSTTGGGKTLNPGDTSPDIPLIRMFSDGLQKDLATGKIKVILDNVDHKIIQDWLAADKMPIIVKKLPKPPPKKVVKKVKPVKAAPPSIHVAKPTIVPLKPGMAITPKIVESMHVSLAQLLHQNDELVKNSDGDKKAKVKEIDQFMGSRV